MASLATMLSSSTDVPPRLFTIKATLVPVEMFETELEYIYKFNFCYAENGHGISFASFVELFGQSLSGTYFKQC